jgi:hypothetical protein
LGTSNSWRIYPKAGNVHTFFAKKGRRDHMMSGFGWQELLGFLASGAMGSLLVHGYQRWLKK